MKCVINADAFRAPNRVIGAFSRLAVHRPLIVRRTRPDVVDARANPILVAGLRAFPQGGRLDPRILRVSSPGQSLGRGRPARPARFRRPRHRRRPQPHSDDEAAPRHADPSRRPRRRRRTERRPPRGRRDRHRRDDHPARDHRQRPPRRACPDPARNRRGDRRPAGALSRHHRRQCRQRRPRQRHAGPDDDARRDLRLARPGRRAPGPGARLLSRPLRDRLQARRGARGDPRSQAARGSRLGL